MERFEPSQQQDYNEIQQQSSGDSCTPTELTPQHHSSNSHFIPLMQHQPMIQPHQKSPPHLGPATTNNNNNHVYSYAYYEPGAAKCHKNLPMKEQLVQQPQPSTSAAAMMQTLPGPSHKSVSPPRNSIKALLARSFRSKTLSRSPPSNSSINPDKYTYTTRYGTTENLYEEVNDQKIRKVLSDNRIGSLGSPTIKEELRRVQHNHFRVLDELNLSLEALIMPPTPPDISPSDESKNLPATTSQHDSIENLSTTLNSIELKDHTCINPEFDEGDLDSGFSGSGSSSGASCNESVRYYKTGSVVMQTTTLPHNIRSCRSSTASGTSTSKSSMNSEDQGIGIIPAILTSPFSYTRRCSDSQRSSKSSVASVGSGGKNKKNFWSIKP